MWMYLIITSNELFAAPNNAIGESTPITRKSSCVNARGIPTAAYQVLLEMGYPPPPARSDRGGTWDGVPPIGVPPSHVWGGYPRWGTPQPGLMGGTRGGVPPGQVQQGGTWGGVPPWPGLTGGTRGGYPPPPGPGRGTPPGVDRQNHRRTDTCQYITFPRTTYVVGKYAPVCSATVSLFRDNCKS